MLAEAEAWKIGTIIVKDMSRFCRNYLEVGFYTEILFPKKQIRFIGKKRWKKPIARKDDSVRAMLRIEPKPRRNAGRRMTVISTRIVSANSASKSFIRTAQGRVLQHRLYKSPSAGRSIVFSAGKAAFRKRGRYGSPQSGKSNAVGAEDEQHP